MSTCNYSNYNSSISINDVSRILHDYRHGAGSYERQTNSQYNYFVNNAHSFPNYGATQSGGNYNHSNGGYYMSSNYL